MKTIKSTEKKYISQSNGEDTYALPPIDAIEDWAYPSSLFIEEKKRYKSIMAMIGFFIIGFSFYWIHNCVHKESLKPSLLAQINKPTQNSILADIKSDMIRDSFDSAEENFIESQIGQEFSYKNDPILSSKAKTIDADQPFSVVEDPKAIQDWLMHQHIKGVAYKDFESRLILNDKIYYLNDVVSAEHHLIWSDIDPVDKKIFFSDDVGNLYSLNY